MRACSTGDSGGGIDDYLTLCKEHHRKVERRAPRIELDPAPAPTAYIL